jgi:hypothetical protein
MTKSTHRLINMTKSKKQKELKSFAKRFYRNTSFKCFGNSIGLAPNLLYLAHGAALGIRNSFGGQATVKNIKPEVSSFVDKLSRDGFVNFGCILKPNLIEQIKSKINTLSHDNALRDDTLSDSGLSRLRNFLVNVPEMEDVFSDPTVNATLKHYFRSEFKLYNSDFYRTYYPNISAEKAKKLFSSLEWHCDNMACSLIKVFIYFTDVTKETGAISIVPKSVSQQLLKEGFNRKDYAKFLPEINENKVELEGKVGTVLLFSTHYCLHKATLPEHGHRDVGVFLVQPSLKQYTPSNEKERNLICRREGYCINPFNNSPLRMDVAVLKNQK